MSAPLSSADSPLVDPALHAYQTPLQRVRRLAREIDRLLSSGEKPISPPAGSASSSRLARRVGRQFVRPKRVRVSFGDTEADHEAVALKYWGIIGFASPNAPKFRGIFRQRYTDFFVTEKPTSSTTVSRFIDDTIPNPPRGGVGRSADERPTKDVASSMSKADLRDALRSASGRSLPLISSTGTAVSLEDSVIEDESVLASDVASSPHDMEEEDLDGDHADDDRTAPVAAALEVADATLATGAEFSPITVPPVSKFDGRSMQQPFEDRALTQFTECSVHKQCCAHSTMMSVLSKALRVHPNDISVAGIKDLVGDTVQRVRIAGVSPASVVAAQPSIQRLLAQEYRPRLAQTAASGSLDRPYMRLSNFSYQPAPLFPGMLWGNHFRITLRDVKETVTDPSAIRSSVEAFKSNGFPNFFGCQRFSWFGGREFDPSLALLHNDVLRYTFLCLDFTNSRLSLRELLQRKSKYPLPFQDSYRRSVIKRLAAMNMQPTGLDRRPLFVTCPDVGVIPTLMASGGLSSHDAQVIEALKYSFMELHPLDRHIQISPFQSYLWNQALAIRVANFGRQVLVGDWILRREKREAAINKTVVPDDRRGFCRAHLEFVTRQNINDYSPFDVVHPWFGFNRAKLPNNVMGDIYKELCSRYSLCWSHDHEGNGYSGMTDGPRCIFVQPRDVSYVANKAQRTLLLEFSLPSGSYANVALKELMKTDDCPGHDAIRRRPLDAQFAGMGQEDKSYIETFQDVYLDWDDEHALELEPSMIDTVNEGEWQHAGIAAVVKHRNRGCGAGGHPLNLPAAVDGDDDVTQSPAGSSSLIGSVDPCITTAADDVGSANGTTTSSASIAQGCLPDNGYIDTPTATTNRSQQHALSGTLTPHAATLTPRARTPASERQPSLAWLEPLEPHNFYVAKREYTRPGMEQIAAWGRRHLLRNQVKIERDRDGIRRELFESTVGRTVPDEEVDRYAGHVVPLTPDKSHNVAWFRKRIELRKLKGGFGKPKFVPKVAIGGYSVRNRIATPFHRLRKETWNRSLW